MNSKNYYDVPEVSLKDYIDPRKFRTIPPECRDLPFGRSEVSVVTELKKNSVLYRKKAVPAEFGKAMFIYGYATVSQGDRLWDILSGIDPEDIRKRSELSFNEWDDGRFLVTVTKPDGTDDYVFFVSAEDMAELFRNCRNPS